MSVKKKSGFKSIECECDYDTVYYPETCDGMVIIELKCQICESTTTVYHYLEGNVENQEPICEDCSFIEDDCTCEVEEDEEE